MCKKRYLFFILFVKLSHLYCQTNDDIEIKKGVFVSSSFCSSIPLGVFSSKNTHLSNSGLAKLGGTLKGSLGYYLNRKWGVLLNYDRVSFPLNSNSVNNSFTESYPQYTVYNTSEGWWVLHNIQVGALNNYYIKRRGRKPGLLVENRCLIGICIINSPGISLFSNNGASSLSFVQSSENTSSFSVSIGGGISNIPTKHLFLKATLDLCQTYGRFRNIQVARNQDGVIASSFKSINQPISYLAIGWAVGWKF